MKFASICAHKFVFVKKMLYLCIVERHFFAMNRRLFFAIFVALGICYPASAIPVDSIEHAVRQQFSVQEVEVVADYADRRADSYRLVSTISNEEMASIVC